MAEKFRNFVDMFANYPKTQDKLTLEEIPSQNGMRVCTPHLLSTWLSKAI